MAEKRETIVEETVQVAREAGSEPCVNIAAYKFVTLDRLPERRQQLKKLCNDLGLRGTILLSGEGINMFLAGKEEAVESFLACLRQDPAFVDLQAKLSYSDSQPFHRMLVKLKREIISFGQQGIEPAKHTSKRVTAEELRKWLSEGQDLLLLDTRNDYEVELGTFKGAVDLGITHFREFPEKVKELIPQHQDRKVIAFCTGGIRCEKAAPYLEKIGFNDVYQLDGGILKYFELCGKEHYEGGCFVFDQRIALDPELAPTGNVQCFACQAVLSQEDLESPYYVYEKSCPHCHRNERQKLQELLRNREEQVRVLTDPLPGSQPYCNRRLIHVPRRLAGLPLIEFLQQWYPPYGEAAWLQAISSGKMTNDLGSRVTEQQIVREGERFVHWVDELPEPNVNPNIRFLYEDRFFIAVDKPAPLPMHPSGRFNRNTLSSFLEPVYRPQKLRVAHRLDANTTGVVLLARTFQAASKIQPQFQSGEVEKVYLALLQGVPSESEFSCDAPISREPGPVGARGVDEDGQPSETRFLVKERFEDGTTLVEVRPLHGRTNQIRVHAWHLGFPIVGDPLYLRGAQVGTQQTLSVESEAMCLHAWKLSFLHPENGQRVSLQTDLPVWLKERGK